jgi:hypothetical protein
MAERIVILREDRFEDGAYSLRARLEDDGSLVIEGQDLGKAPEEFWGSREYEWTITVQAEAVPSLVGALGGIPEESDPLDLLASRYRESSFYGTRGFLDDAGIPCEFWSRVGD